MTARSTTVGCLMIVIGLCGCYGRDSGESSALVSHSQEFIIPPNPMKAATADLVIVGVLSEIQVRAMSVTYMSTLYYDTGILTVEEVLKGDYPLDRLPIMISSLGRPGDELYHTSPPRVSNGDRAIWILNGSNYALRNLYLLSSSSSVVPLSMKAEVLKWCSSPSATFVNKVWKVTDSPGGASGELYVFLSEGTLVIASPEGRPKLGRWSLDGDRLKLMEEGLPYEVEILALDESAFRIQVRSMGHQAEIGFVPAEQATPNSTRSVEFDPAKAKIIANGKNPHWLLIVDGPTAFFRTAEEGSLNYTGGEWEQVDAPSWRYEARRTGAGGEETLVLTITRSLCVDSESGAESPLRAVLVRDGKRLEGCAVAGESMSRSDTE